MKVDIESVNESLGQGLVKRLVDEVTCALQAVVTQADEFVVNDTHWFWQNTRGSIRPTVVNSAHYITSNFQNALERQGWEKEAIIDGQRFDGLLEFEEICDCYALDEDKFLPLLESMRATGGNNFGLKATSIFRHYVQSTTPFLSASVVEFLPMFDVDRRRFSYRVGLEFETGNIASSFRAIDKLQGLYNNGRIDVGIFVTSKTKSDGAARIWPVSNRNGSFEELRMRNYEAQRSYPHIDISFRPDRYSPKAKYLSKDATYSMDFTGEILEIDGISYKKAVTPQGEAKLLPILAATSIKRDVP
ncbi:hypothetical protein N9C16_08455 [Paracoccaceae bacterium]|jgi:hypothetical protein|nr:hypothetical protein [Paracoccaceae bacterium]